MRFVYEQEVRAEVLEVDTVVSAVIQQRAGAGLERVDHLGEPLDRAAAAAWLRGEGLPVAGRQIRQVGGFGRRMDGDRGERAVRHHHRVPVAGGAPGGEQFPCLGAVQVFAGGHQDPRGREEPFPFAGGLLQQVVGDDDERFAHQAEFFELAGGHEHGRRLAGPHRVGAQARWRGEDPVHHVPLVRVRREPIGHAGEGEVEPS